MVFTLNTIEQCRHLYIWYVLPYVRLLSFSFVLEMLSCCSVVVYSFSLSYSVLLYGYIPFYYMDIYHNSLIHSSVDGYLDCFQFGLVLQCCYEQSCTCFLVNICTRFCWYVYLEMELLSHIGCAYIQLQQILPNNFPK